MKRHLFIAVLLASILSVPMGYAQDGAGIAVGSGPKEVYSALGKPLGTVVKGGRVTWMYLKGSVVFENGKVARTTFKAAEAEKARNAALLEAEKRKAAAKSSAGAEQMKRTVPAPQTVVPEAAPSVSIKMSEADQQARAEAAAKLEAANATRTAEMAAIKEPLVAAERQMKADENIVPDEARLKKYNLAMQAYEVKAREIEGAYRKAMAEVSQTIKAIDARHARRMAEQARVLQQRRATPRAAKTTRLPILPSGKKICPVCKMMLAPAGKTYKVKGKLYKLYQCPIGHKCLGE